MINHEEDNPINWDEIIKSGKGVIASDRKRSGTVIAQTKDDVVISDGVIKRHQFIMPKSKVDYYDGSDITLKSHRSCLVFLKSGNKLSD
jgi:hypothetical protein